MSSLEGPADFKKPHSELTEDEMNRHKEQADREILKFFKKNF